MTLRHLLSHTAGFTHEAPVGNNSDLQAGSFEEHVRSISETWLRFPVGQHYAYSNLRIDLAAYVVERQSGVPFPEYVRTRLFEPLAMTRSSLDPARIVAEPNRARGHDVMHLRVPVQVPMLAAGGMYSTAEDLARYVRFQLNKGRVGDHRVLAENRITEMQSPPSFFTRTQGYGLGLARLERPGPPVYGHSGGGFGFLSDMYWYPDLGVGGVVLTNSTEHGLLQNRERA